MTCAEFWKATPSDLLDVPHGDCRGADVALDILAKGGLDKELPGRNIGHDLEGALLYFGGNFLARLRIGRLDPLHPQFLELVVARPAEPRPLAIGAPHDVGRRVEQVGTNPAGFEHDPATFGGRLF